MFWQKASYSISLPQDFKYMLQQHVEYIFGGALGYIQGVYICDRICENVHSSHKNFNSFF